MSRAVTPRELHDPDAAQTIRRVYTVAAEPADRHRTLSDIGRGVNVTGKLLQTLADRYNGVGKKYAGMLALLGTIFWNLVEVSVPVSGSIARSFYLHWLKLLTLIGVAIFAFGFIPGVHGLRTLGIEILLVVVVLTFISSALARFVKSGTFIGAMSRVVLLLLVLGTGFFLCIVYGTQIAGALHKLETLFIKAASLRAFWPSALCMSRRYARPYTSTLSL